MCVCVCVRARAVCVCVCVCVRERERGLGVCMYVCVCVCLYVCVCVSCRFMGALRWAWHSETCKYVFVQFSGEPIFFVLDYNTVLAFEPN